jgi:hypothetical protein
MSCTTQKSHSKYKPKLEKSTIQKGKFLTFMNWLDRTSPTEPHSGTYKLSITHGNNNISGYSIKNNSMLAATITEYVGRRKGKTRWWCIYPLRKYAFDREGFNSIALFASAIASEQKSRNLVAKISKSL